mmetsp:Transcript_1129/g.3181  ORF Transcript_1129/g.3181 Transcript_1129/m.3181 type:complete len:284 (-) Transcript_1129:470-1321(-)
MALHHLAAWHWISLGDTAVAAPADLRALRGEDQVCDPPTGACHLPFGAQGHVAHRRLPCGWPPRFHHGHVLRHGSVRQRRENRRAPLHLPLLRSRASPVLLSAHLLDPRAHHGRRGLCIGEGAVLQLDQPWHRHGFQRGLRSARHPCQDLHGGLQGRHPLVPGEPLRCGEHDRLRLAPAPGPHHRGPLRRRQLEGGARAGRFLPGAHQAHRRHGRHLLPLQRARLHVPRHRAPRHTRRGEHDQARGGHCRVHHLLQEPGDQGGHRRVSHRSRRRPCLLPHAQR